MITKDWLKEQIGQPPINNRPNFAYVYRSDNYVAKVFDPRLSNEAGEEFVNLMKLEKLNDSRLNVPKVYDLIFVGNSLDFPLNPWSSDYDGDICAVIMDWVGGSVPTRKNKEPICDLLAAMQEHRVYRSDLKIPDMRVENGRLVTFDTHKFKTVPESDEFLTWSLNHMAEVLFSGCTLTWASEDFSRNSPNTNF